MTLATINVNITVTSPTIRGIIMLRRNGWMDILYCTIFHVVESPVPVITTRDELGAQCIGAKSVR